MQQEIYFSGLKGSFSAVAKLKGLGEWGYDTGKQKLKNGKIVDKTAGELEELVLEPYVFQTKKFYPLSLKKDERNN